MYATRAFAVSNVSLSSSGDSMNNSNHELLASQIGLTRQFRQNINVGVLISLKTNLNMRYGTKLMPKETFFI